MLSVRFSRLSTLVIAKRFRVRSLSARPETTWREAVSDKTAALDARMKGTDERLASVQKAMEVNKEAIDKAVSATEKGVKDAVGCTNTAEKERSRQPMRASTK